jgi:ribosomal protein S18 acetylase RimI-like enzyme
MEHVKQRLRDERCQDVHLWVDADREAARRLYLGSGFKERERVDDYYGPGRTGIKMVLDL